jgi:hypothetical protein
MSRFAWVPVVLAMMVAGACGATPWVAVPIGAVAILWLRDQGQHVERIRREGKTKLGRITTGINSVAASLAVATVECGVAWLLGASARWVIGGLVGLIT